MIGMDVEIARDVTSFDPELMHLQEVSTAALKEHPQLADQLYSQWFMVPGSQALKGRTDIVRELMEGCPESAKAVAYQGESVAHLAVKSNCLEVMELIHGVDEILMVNDDKGNTALHVSVALKQFEFTDSEEPSEQPCYN